MIEEAFTVGQIEAALADAMREGDMPAVGALLGRLAMVAPDHAQLIIDVIGLNASTLAGEDEQ